MQTRRFDVMPYIKLAIAFSLGAVSSCGGGGDANGSSPAGPSMTQFSALQAAVSELQTEVAALKTGNAGLQTEYAASEARLTADETLLAKIALLGHQPGMNSVASWHAAGLEHHAPAGTQSFSYGPCSDMGVLVGNNQADALTATVEEFRQCTGYEYGVVVDTGAIAKPLELWFDGLNCTGNMFEAEGDGVYNRQVLQSGVVFVSPIDGVTELMVVTGQAGQTTTLLSNFSGGSCNSGAQEVQTSYRVVPNDLNISGVPSAVPANFIL